MKTRRICWYITNLGRMFRRQIKLETRNLELKTHPIYPTWQYYYYTKAFLLLQTKDVLVITSSKATYRGLSKGWKLERRGGGLE